MKLKRLFCLLIMLTLLCSAVVISAEAATLADVKMTSAQGHHTGNIIRWNSVSGAQFYQVYRLYSGESTWTLVANTSGTAYKDTTAQVGARCYYKVRARSGSVISSMNIPSISVVRPLADVTMTGTTPHVTGNIVRWNAVYGAKLYQVFRLVSGETTWTLLANTSGTAYKDTTAQVGVRCYYKVRARKGDLMSSMNITSVAAVRPLGNVTMSSAQGHETGNIVSWNALYGAKLYQVYRLESGQSSWQLLANTGATAYKDTTAKEGVRYYYKVRARNGNLISSMDIASVSAIRPKQKQDPTALYMEFMRSGEYLSWWDAEALPNLPTGYAILDLNQNGCPILILFGPANFEPWNNYMVFDCNLNTKQVYKLPVNTGNDNYCYNEMYYSKQQKALVFGCMSPFGGAFFMEYYSHDVTSMNTFGSIGTMYSGAGYEYSSTLPGDSGPVSKSVYDARRNELTKITFSPMP